MSLESGYYTIHHGNNLVGRSLAENYSLLPKSIYNATTDPHSIWQIESLPGGKYRFRNFDAPVTAIKGYLQAIIYPNIDENSKIFEWDVLRQPHGGENVYTIINSANEYWHTTADTFSPIAVRPPLPVENPPPVQRDIFFRIEPVKLQSGIYTIHNGFNPVGRALVEDLSLNPKPILNDTDAPRSLWYIQAEKNGKYKLKNLGAPVAARNNLLYAFLHDVDPTDTKFDWNIEPQFHQGRFLFTITNSDHNGWLATSDKFSQIEVGPLPTTASLPPQYFPHALFRIVPFVIKTGFYTIRNDNDLVGRAAVEIASLDPKPILNKTDNPDATWYIQALGPYRYKLSASQTFGPGAPGSESDKLHRYNPVGVEEETGSFPKVYAFLDPKFVAPTWIIIPRFNYGEDVYTIQLESPIFLDRSWFAHTEEKSQIEIHNVLLQDPLPLSLRFKIDPLFVPIQANVIQGDA